MKRMMIAISLITLCSFASPAQRKHFERVDKFPEGEQVRHSIGSLMGGIKDVNVEEFTFDSPYEKVWPATKRAAQNFSKIGKRSVSGLEEQNGRIQVGRITQNAMIGMGPGAWLDEFVLEATKVSPATTKVSVVRKVVEKEMTGDRPVKTQWSNGKIEKYLLTQIEDEINKASVAPEAASVGASTEGLKSLAGKYVSTLSSIQTLDLKPDGTFDLQLSSFSGSGKFEVADDVLTLNLEQMGGREMRHSRAQRAKIQGDSIADLFGMTWVKQGGNSTPGAKPSETLTNENVLRMAEAKLPDSVIISKIKNSKCTFNTSTDALIQLKQAGVSDAVIQAMVDATSK